MEMNMVFFFVLDHPDMLAELYKHFQLILLHSFLPTKPVFGGQSSTWLSELSGPA